MPPRGPFAGGAAAIPGALHCARRGMAPAAREDVMPTLRTDLLVFALAVATMLAVRFWAALAGSEILGLVTLIRIVVGSAILGGVVAIWTPRNRSALALAIGVTGATIAASIFTRGGFDPEAAAGASLMGIVVSVGSFVVIRRIAAWVRAQGRAVQGLLALVGLGVAIGLVVLGTAAR